MAGIAAAGKPSELNNNDSIVRLAGSVVSRNWLRGRMTAVGLAATLAFGLNACGPSGNGGQRPPPSVSFVTVHTQPVTLTAELPGRTVPYRISDVRPQVSGLILKRLFTEGGKVEAGQTLYQIDPKPYQAAYDSARAALANAQAILATNRAKAARYAKLFKQNAIAAQTYDDAEAAYQQARANVDQAKANLETARINLDYTKVKAPISGRAGISAVTEGALVTADQATALTTVQALNPIYVNIAQSSSQVLALRQAVAQGQLQQDTPITAEVSLELDDGTNYPLKGKLQFTDVTVDPNTGAVTLRALFPNPKGLLLPGMYVRATIAEGVNPHAILVPQQGVAHNLRGEATALVIGKDNKIAERILTISRAIGNQWLVTSGLKAGDRLVVQGVQKVRAGMTVQPEEVTLAADGSATPVKADAAKPSSGQ